jgi:hypothetical protein
MLLEKSQIRVGSRTIGPSGKTVQHGFLPAAVAEREFKNGAAVV